MSQGPCDLDELVLVNVTTREGYCGSRLCGPDRVFLFGDQLCHDPREPGICPLHTYDLLSAGRILYTSQYGTPVCGCADGTYEEDNDFDDDNCQPILTEIDSCPSGEVLWFKTFKQPPLCRPDPCNGLNLNRPEQELPYVPSLRDGKCYQIGSQPNICCTDQFYSVDMVELKGVCQRLGDAGFTIYNPQDFTSITSQFGKPLDKDTTTAFPKPAKPSKPSNTSVSKPSISEPSKPSVDSEEKSPPKQNKRPLTPASTTLIQGPVIGSPVTPAHSFDVTAPLVIGASVVPPLSPFINVDGSISCIDLSGMKVATGTIQRQPFATPGNVFEPGLTSCRAGASKDLNAICRNIILPPRYPPRKPRPRRTAPPIRPASACGGFGNSISEEDK